MSEHNHGWRMVAHLDGCHWWESTFVCDCGAARVVWYERKFKERGKITYSVMHAGENCERCSELLGGARRKRRIDKIEEAVR